MTLCCDLSTCCCCIPTKAGTIIIGFLDIILTFVGFGLMGALFANCGYGFSIYSSAVNGVSAIVSTGNEDVKLNLFTSCYILLMVFKVTLVLFTLVMLIGTCMNKTGPIYAWVVHETINAIFLVIVVALILNDPIVNVAIFMPDPRLKVLATIWIIFWTGIKWYFISVPYSHYKLLKMKNINMVPLTSTIVNVGQFASLAPPAVGDFVPLINEA